jgi:Holliday junction DNA helicase RuvA
VFFYLQGTAAHSEPGLTVVDCGGVGFACATSLQTLSRVKVGEAVKLYTHVNVREDAIDIYGFLDTGERDCFRMLTAISGVGPKAALSILGVNTPERLALSVLAADERALTQAPGVGKKLAQRIILELKDKLGKASLPSDAAANAQGLPLDGSVYGEVAAALAVLGYSAAETGQALRGLDLEMFNVEQAIRAALKNLMPKL